MMNGAIFHLQPDGKLIEMREADYDSEDVLQKLIAEYPNLLAGDQIDPGTPRRWLLVSREMGVPGEEDAHDRWSLDHLFLDQDAIPTLVEVKRSSDTRIRREVVGQLLDYAANAVAYWTVEKLQTAFEKTCSVSGKRPEDELVRFLFPQGVFSTGYLPPDGTGFSMEIDPTVPRITEFWQQADTNLKAGKIRLVFVANEIPPELRRVVGFLNDQMERADVLAVEIKQFIGTGGKTLVPRVFGAADKVRPVVGKKWDESSFFLALAKGRPELEVEAARGVLKWAAGRSDLRPVWGSGGTVGGLLLTLPSRGLKWTPAVLQSTGTVEVPFTRIKYPPFDSDDLREEFRTRLNRVPGVEIPATKIAGYASFPLALLVDPTARQQFFDALDWFFVTVQAHSPT